MFGRLGDLFEEAGLFAVEVGYIATHPELWDSYSSQYSNDDSSDIIQQPDLDEHISKNSDNNLEKNQQIAEVYVKKAEILNTVMRQHTAQGNSEVYSAIQNVKKLADILERNIQGTMTANDVLEMEQQMSTWGKEIGSLVKTFDDIM